MTSTQNVHMNGSESETKRRVDAILNSPALREELERIVENHVKAEGASANFQSRISDITNGHGGKPQYRCLPKGDVVPICDIDDSTYSIDEKLMRCKLAAVYRLVDMFGWSEAIYNHVTVRLDGEEEQFLINPFGLMYNEITASSLVKIDLQGNTIDPGSTTYGINVAGFNLHSAVHAARHDLRAVVHVHLPAVIAVSSCPEGLIPLCHEGVMIGRVSMHEYMGIVIDPAERQSIVKDLGPVNKVMLLRNHGMICCGANLEEALLNTMLAIEACEAQVRAMSMGLGSRMISVSPEWFKFTYEAAKKGGGGVNSQQEGLEGCNKGKKETGRQWGIGELEFEAYMRMLDRAGLRTGYVYKQAVHRSDQH